MKLFVEEIQRIYDRDSLTDLKEQLKDQVVDPSLSWQSRMDLYEKIKWINLRLEHLKKK
ncbi:hypothetical protein [Ammoniphilus sp. YIM 78166]|uniref:hypothetical protein n=1 Tax=Ammoniphilus sp. YIM 78166 TaxID=1644106 RepID=UPI0014316832|nr:hypothetical protein [Ammoniphilus sp. YIM 78166]